MAKGTIELKIKIPEIKILRDLVKRAGKAIVELKKYELKK